MYGLKVKMLLTAVFVNILKMGLKICSVIVGMHSLDVEKLLLYSCVPLALAFCSCEYQIITYFTHLGAFELMLTCQKLVLGCERPQKITHRFSSIAHSTNMILTSLYR